MGCQRSLIRWKVGKNKWHFRWNENFGKRVEIKTWNKKWTNSLKQRISSKGKLRNWVIKSKYGRNP